MLLRAGRQESLDGRRPDAPMPSLGHHDYAKLACLAEHRYVRSAHLELGGGLHRCQQHIGDRMLRNNRERIRTANLFVCQLGK